MFTYRLIDFEPVDNFAKKISKIILRLLTVEFIITMSSFGIPASMSFKVETKSVVADPILNNKQTY